jgi:hypothetical protein
MPAPIPLPDHGAHAVHALFISPKRAPRFNVEAKAMCLRHSKYCQYSRAPMRWLPDIHTGKTGDVGLGPPAESAAFPQLV